MIEVVSKPAGLRWLYVESQHMGDGGDGGDMQGDGVVVVHQAGRSLSWKGDVAKEVLVHSPDSGSYPVGAGCHPQHILLPRLHPQQQMMKLRPLPPPPATVREIILNYD